MQAIIRTKAGKEFSSMQVQEVPAPVPLAGQVKVRMAASRINPVDMDLMKGFPTLKYKTPQIGGVDGAGEVVALGSQVTDFTLGDQVYFYRRFTDIGTWANEITIAASDIAKIPQGLSAEQAGSIALPLLTAYESLMALQAKAGESILIHGAGGGVGFQAVQLAKSMGLNIIANGSGRDQTKLEQAGVDQFINYKEEPFLPLLSQSPPDYVFDVIGKQTLLDSIALGPKKVVSIAFPDVNQMYKTGVQLPWLLKSLMQLMNRKFVRVAAKNNVTLIGQVTGASGTNLNAAARLVEKNDYTTTPFQQLTLTEIKQNGLTVGDLGKVIVFK